MLFLKAIKNALFRFFGIIMQDTTEQERFHALGVRTSIETERKLVLRDEY